MNISIALEREGKATEALATLNDVDTDDAELTLRLQVARVALLCETGAYENTISLAQNVLSQLDEDEPPADLVAALHARLGEALWRLDKNMDAALAEAWKSIQEHKGNPTALWLIREIDKEISASARYFRIMIRGEWA